MRDRPATTSFGRYLFRNPALRTAMRLADATAGLLNRRASVTQPIPPPRRILVSNIAHFGDVVIALAVVPVLKRAFPEAEIGFLAGSWSRELLELFPDIKWIHAFDHFLLNRQARTMGGKIGAHWQTFHQASREIREIHYDVGIELFYFLQNAIPLLWWSGIPARIGYTSGGLGPLLTHPMEWHYKNQHVLAYHLQLLAYLGIDEPVPSRLVWPPRKSSPTPVVVPPEKYDVVIHPGGGAGFRAWPLERWRAVVKALSDRGYRMVFTGRGMSEAKNIETISRDIPNCLDLCDRLDWAQFIRVIEGARLLVGIESVAGHFAAAADIPSVLVYTGTVNPRTFGPLSEKLHLLSHSVPCAPCFLTHGCDGMECVRNVSAETVLEACIKTLVPVSTPSSL
jgi:ADP-heptose:LPS heptosyltransferase